MIAKCLPQKRKYWFLQSLSLINFFSSIINTKTLTILNQVAISWVMTSRIQSYFVKVKIKRLTLAPTRGIKAILILTNFALAGSKPIYNFATVYIFLNAAYENVKPYNDMFFVFLLEMFCKLCGPLNFHGPSMLLWVTVDFIWNKCKFLRQEEDFQFRPRNIFKRHTSSLSQLIGYLVKKRFVLNYLFQTLGSVHFVYKNWFTDQH